MGVTLLAAMVAGPLVTVVLAAIAVLASTGRLRRNGTIGIRLASTVASDAARRAGHRAAVRPTCCWSPALLLLDGVVLLLRPSGAPGGLLALLLVPGATAILWIAVAAGREARAVAGP